MTRFARAKGSKASNERIPNEATPWYVMKQQLEDTVSTKKGEYSKTKSAKQLLEEKDDAFYSEAPGNVNNDWAEFEVPVTEKKKLRKQCSSTDKSVESLNQSTETVEVACKEKKIKKNSESSQDVISSNVQTVVTNDNKIPLHQKSKKRKSTTSIENSAETTVEQLEEPEIPKKKKKNKTESPVSESSEVKNFIKVKDENVSKIAEKNGSVVMSKRQKRNLKHKNKIANNEADGPREEKPGTIISGGFNATGNDWGSNVNFGKQSIEKQPNAPVPKAAPKFKKPLNNFNGQQANNTAKRKAPKVRDDGEHKRRKPDAGSLKCVINGMEIEIVKYDGFPVKKEDAERLKELKKNMLMKGIPKADVDRAMKLERRKAEKALARVRKQVCFNCRKAGHNLSDCPELGKEEGATGICFKCGSTEHTHFECKVMKKEEFRFASCFICREQGHIAKQCPDNPKGLYPQGGACKICGDVTHLMKDCPDLSKEKEENTVTLNTITDGKLESLDEDITSKNGQNEDTKLKIGKVVKF